MVTEIEKRIEEELESIWNGERKEVEYKFKNFDTGFEVGAKFILELPELKEAVKALEFYADRCKGHEGMAPQYNELNDLNCINENFGEISRQALEKLKALGIVKEGEK